MLILKQVTQPYEVYKKIRDKARRDKFDYSQLEKAQNEREYRQMIRKAQSEFLIEDILTLY